jgi:hypothetical protein
MCQMILVNLAMVVQGRDDVERHRGIICPSPGGWTQRIIKVAQARRGGIPLEPEPGDESTMAEKTLPERVTDGQALQRALGTYQAILRLRRHERTPAGCLQAERAPRGLDTSKGKRVHPAASLAAQDGSALANGRTPAPVRQGGNPARQSHAEPPPPSTPVKVKVKIKGQSSQ